MPFEVYGTVPGSIALEAAAHRKMRNSRLNKKREFFRVTPNEALAVVIACAPTVQSAAVATGNEGHRRFSAWLDLTGKTQSNVAEDLGVSLSTVCRWVGGSRRPGINQAVKIQSVTGIPVPAWAKPKEKTQ